MSVPRKPFPLARVPAGSHSPAGPGAVRGIKPWPIPESELNPLEAEYRRAVERAFAPQRPEPEPDPFEFMWDDC